MNEIESAALSSRTRRVLAILLIGGLVTLIYLILDPFLSSIAWALVLAHSTWPMRQRLQGAIGARPTACALIMVVGMGVIIFVPLLWLTLIIQDNVVAGYRTVAAYLVDGKFLLPEVIARIPWLGQELQNWINGHLIDPVALNQQLMLWSRKGASQFLDLFGDIGRNIAKIAFTAITLFVLYRDGDTVLHNLKNVLRSLLGERINGYFRTAGEMSRAVMYSMIVSALVQGTIAGIGFRIFGVAVPVLLGALTAVVSIIPVVGTFLIWGPISAWLFLSGHPWQALGLLAWGILLIHPADNLIRPLVISNAMRIPFLLVMFGVFGGIAAFGLIGLFVGPVVLAVALAAWNEWVQSVNPGTNLTGQK